MSLLPSKLLHSSTSLLAQNARTLTKAMLKLKLNLLAGLLLPKNLRTLTLHKLMPRLKCGPSQTNGGITIASGQMPGNIQAALEATGCTNPNGTMTGLPRLIQSGECFLTVLGGSRTMTFWTTGTQLINLQAMTKISISKRHSGAAKNQTSGSTVILKMTS